MGVQDQGNVADGVLDALDEVLSLVRAHGAGHILQADGIEAHVLELLAHLDVLFDRVDRALGVRDTAGGDGVLGRVLLGGFQRGGDVAEVVQRVKDTQDVDAVLDGQLDELLDDVVMIVLVAEQVLAAKQHLQLGVGHGLADVAQSLPGILAQVTQAGVERSAAPAFHRIVAGLVHFRQDIGKIGIRKTGRHQRLVGITKDSFSNLNFFHVCSSIISRRMRRSRFSWGIHRKRHAAARSRSVSRAIIQYIRCAAESKIKRPLKFCEIRQKFRLRA